MTNPTTNFGWVMPTATDLVTDLPADFNVFGQAVDTSMAGLLGGTTGQVLSKTSSTDLAFTWVSDATGMANPMTTTGDTIYSSPGSTPVRRAIGTTGQVLTVAGGIPTWSTPTTGSNWTLLNAGGTALTGATTITVSGISSVDKVMILVNNASAANSGSTISLRANADSGSNYYNFGTQLEIASTYNTDIASIVGSNGDATNAFRFATMGSNAGSQFAGYISLTGCNSSGVKMFQTVGAANNGTGSNFVHRIVGGYYNSASTISSISILSSSGNFDAGTIFVYTSA